MRAPLLLVLAVPLVAPLAVPLAARLPSARAQSLTERAAAFDALDLEALLATARKREARGDLALAREAWLRAAPRLPLGANRDAAVGAARAIEDRLALRAEIADYGAAVPGAFASLGFGAADDETIEIAGEPIPWVEVDIDLLRRAAKLAKLSGSAQRGVVQEALVRGTPSEMLAALKDLAKIHAKGEWPATDVFAAVARARGEDYPEGGYVLVKGSWRRAADEARAASSSALEDAARTFAEADAAARDGALGKLEARGVEGVARAAALLEARWRAAFAALQRGIALEQLQALAAQRAELDARREAALQLIFDTERYFYPYNPPACPPERARLYAGVQQEVNKLVGAARVVWDAPKRARLSAAFRAALEEIAWNRAAQVERKLDFTWDPVVPAWVAALDPARDVVDLASFALDAREAADLARDRALTTLNEATWKKGGFDAASSANAEEQEQVRVTNRYRALLGRRVLAWNPKIQSAAQGHADYMSKTGDFGHFQPDPTRHSPADRLKLAGYALGGSENCHMGDSGAEGAHLGWTHSSGHHRNLLEANHREMASAIAGPYWCQNFGAGREFESVLDVKPAR